MNRTFTTAIVTGCAAALMGVSGAGVGARGRDGRAGATGQASPQQPPTFRTSIDAVQTDTIVRDARGNFVGNLTKDDFELFEDGVKQDIVWLEKVQGGRVFATAAPAARPHEEGVILPPTRATPEASGRVFVFLVDDLHLSFGRSPQLKDLFRKIARDLVHDGDEFGIVSTGPSSLAIDLTYERKQLDRAITRISGAGLTPSDIINGPQNTDGPSEVRYRAHVAFSTALDLVARLESIKGRRKAVVYVSEGYDFNPYAEERAGGDPTFAARAGQARQIADQQRGDYFRQGQGFADADLAVELGELTRAANRANATIYTIDPQGLVAGPDIGENVSATAWQDHMKKAHDSLRVLAEQTGGIAIVDQNDLGKGLKKIDAETSDYYMLAYYPKNTDQARRTRHIEVRVKRPGVTVWSRTSYSLKPAR
jgi:VWFA-related protein